MFSKQIGSKLYFLRRSFSEVVDPQKIAWINKTLQNYKVEDKLAPYKEKIAGDIEYKVLNLPKTATVRQIYTAYTILDKSLKAPDVKNKEAKAKILEQSYHILIMTKIKAFDTLTQAEKNELDELLKQKLRLMSNVNLSTTQQFIQINEAKVEKVWKEPKYYPLLLIVCWLGLGYESFQLEP